MTFHITGCKNDHPTAERDDSQGVAVGDNNITDSDSFVAINIERQFIFVLLWSECSIISTFKVLMLLFCGKDKNKLIVGQEFSVIGAH